jgi:hypothetical protein
LSELKKLSNSLVNSEISLYDFLQTDNDILIHSQLESMKESCEIFINRTRESSGAVDLAQFSQGQFEQVLKKRIMGHLRLGYHLDHCISDLFDAGFEPINLRGFADKITYYLTYLRQAGVAQFPIEMQYGFNQQFCTISFSVSVSHFVKEYLYTAAQKTVDLADPLSNLIAQAKELGHFVEIIYIESSKKLVINGSWLKQKVNHNLLFAMYSIPSAKLLPLKRASANLPIKNWNQENLEELEQKTLENNHIEVIAPVEVVDANELKDQLEDSFVASFSGAEVDEDEMQVIKSTIKEVAKDPLQIIKGTPREKDENAILIFQSLKDKLKNVDEQKLQRMVNETLENYIQKQREVIEKQDMRVGGGEFGHMHETIKQKDTEIENLKNKVKTLFHELKAFQNTAQVKANLDKEVQVEVEADPEIVEELEKEIVKRDQIIETLQTHETLTQENREQITELLVKQGELAKEKHLLEMNVKKLEIEARQKESILLQQMQAKEKLLSGKDTMLLKMKESLTRLGEVKDKTIKGLNDRLSILNSEISELKVVVGSGKVDALQRDNANLNQNLTKIKAQFEEMSNQYKLLKNNNSGKATESELKQAKSTLNQLETKFASKEQEISSILKILNENKTELQQKIAENQKLAQEIKNYQKANAVIVETPVTSSPASTVVDQAVAQELKDTKKILDEKENMIKALELKLIQAEKDKAQVLANTASGPTEAEHKQLTLKLEKLEKEKLKMMEDVRNKTKESAEAIVGSKKLKAEVTALQNRIKLIEQENQKLKTKNAAGQNAKKAS